MSWNGYTKARRQVREALTGAECGEETTALEACEIHNLVLFGEEEPALLPFLGETWRAISKYLKAIAAGGFAGRAPRGLVRAYQQFFTRAGLFDEREAAGRAELLLGRILLRQTEHLAGLLPADESPAALAAAAAELAGAHLIEVADEDAPVGGKGGE